MRVKDLGGNLAFYVPLTDAVTLSAEKADPIWLQVAAVGEWFNVRHGEIPITLDDLKAMYRNFKTGEYPPKPQELPVDYEHLSVKPDRKPGDGIASGWFKDLDLRDDGRELWALIDWTDPAREKIRNKEYKGFSPVIHPNWTTHGKKEIGPTLLGGAITNYQTIPSCVLTCSLDPASTTSVRELASLLDLPLSDRERRIREAFGVAYPEVKTYPEGYVDWEKSRWFRDADDENAYFSFGGKIFGIKYNASDDLTITFEGEPFEVVSRYEPVVSLSGENTMKLKDAQGKDIEIPNASLAGLTLDALADIIPAVKDLRSKVPAEGTRVVPAAEFDTLAQSVTALSQQVDTLKTENAAHKTRADAAASQLLDQELDALSREGRMLPTERDEMKELAQSNRALFDKIVTKRRAAEPIIRLSQQHGSDNHQSGNTGSAVQRFDDLVTAKRTANPALTYVDAIKLAQTENPELAKARNMEIALPVGPGGVVMGAGV